MNMNTHDETLQALAGKLRPLVDSQRLDNIVDLISLTSDLVDLLDQPMVEKLGLLSEQAAGAAWTASNSVRAAHAQTLAEAHPPSLMGLLALLRDEDTRRGVALVLRSLQSVGRQMGAQRADYATP